MPTSHYIPDSSFSSTTTSLTFLYEDPSLTSDGDVIPALSASLSHDYDYEIELVENISSSSVFAECMSFSRVFGITFPGPSPWASSSTNTSININGNVNTNTNTTLACFAAHNLQAQHVEYHLDVKIADQQHFIRCSYRKQVALAIERRTSAMHCQWRVEDIDGHMGLGYEDEYVDGQLYGQGVRQLGGKFGSRVKHRPSAFPGLVTRTCDKGYQHQHEYNHNHSDHDLEHQHQHDHDCNLGLEPQYRPYPYPSDHHNHSKHRTRTQYVVIILIHITIFILIAYLSYAGGVFAKWVLSKGMEGVAFAYGKGGSKGVPFEFMESVPFEFMPEGLPFKFMPEGLPFEFMKGLPHMNTPNSETLNCIFKFMIGGMCVFNFVFIVLDITRWVNSKGGLGGLGVSMRTGVSLSVDKLMRVVDGQLVVVVVIFRRVRWIVVKAVGLREDRRNGRTMCRLEA